MKRLILAIFFSMMYILSNAQYIITTEGKMIKQYNFESKQFEQTSIDYDCTTMFEINSNNTMIKHTTNKLTSTYYIKDGGVEYLESGDQYVHYNVISDVGNRYDFNFSKNSVCIFNLRADVPYCVIFFVKQYIKE